MRHLLTAFTLAVAATASAENLQPGAPSAPAAPAAPAAAPPEVPTPPPAPASAAADAATPPVEVSTPSSAAAAPPPAVSPAPAPTPAPANPYALPFQLRPIVQPTLGRLETAAAWHGVDSTKYAGFNDVGILTVGYAATKSTGFGLRVPFVYNAPDGPGAPASILQFANPAVVVTHTPFPTEPIRVGFSGAVSIPVGNGKGMAGSAAAKAANTTGMLTRLAMDNLLFLPNDLSFASGVSCAYVAGGLTIQADVTMLNTFKVRKAPGDNARTNGLMGVGAGYFLTPSVSVGAELLYQHWLTTPAAVAVDDLLRSNLSGLVGARYHHKTDWGWARPGLALAQGLSGYTDRTTEVRFDLPMIF